MAKKCQSCGGTLVESGYGKYSCPWCGSEWTEADLAEEGRVSDLEVFSLLNKARTAIELDYDFTTSLRYSQSVLEKNPSSQEANWLALLAENQIAYIQNEKGKYTPTFLAPEGKTLPSSRYYKALNAEYKANGDAIEKLRLATLEEFRKIKPYDVFISYKQHESGEGSAETKEAVWARDIYTELKTNPKTKHLHVFFDQKCLTGSNAGWEPHIYAAIRSSKCMILLGSTIENINSRWVKNEWKRFLSYKNRGEKKDIIVLGSDAVNPLLLDATLQEKQMITNTSGRWLGEICSRVVDICGKPVKERPEKETPPPKPKKKKNKKARAAIIILLILALAGGGVAGGLYLKNSFDAINEVAALIEYIPASGVSDYSQYEDIIEAALDEYEALADWKKSQVKNRDRLLSVVEEYNVYKVEKLRYFASEVNVETVEESDALANTVAVYQDLTSDQKALLTSDEIFQFDNFVKVYNVITSLNAINDDVLNKYGEVEGVKRTYLTIDAAYRDLVYNYGLIDTFGEQVAFYNSFTFTEVAGGYSIALAEGKTLSGEIELPSRYNGQNVVEIPEGAFKDCRGITSLTVPDTVQTISKGAFEGCNNIVDITLPFTGKSETAGGSASTNYERVFGWIFGYETQYSMSAGAAGSAGFRNVIYGSVDGAIWQYTYAGGGGYYSSLNSYFFYIPSTIRTVCITKQEDITLAAFNGCRMISTVSYIKELTEIGDCAFQNCTSLNQFNSEIVGMVDLKGNVETVGAYAFAGCTSLTSVAIPESIHVFGEHAFDGDRGIAELTLTDHITQIGDYAFQGLNLLTSLTIFNSTVSIGCGAFQGCNCLVNISIPFTGKSESAGGTASTGYEQVFGWIFGYDTQYSMSAGAAGSAGFRNVIYGSVDGAICQYTYAGGGGYYSSLESYFFYIPSSLHTVTITKQVDIPLAAFNNCTMLTKITYTNKIMSTGEYAFSSCVSPTESISLMNRQYALPITKKTED